MPLESHRQSFIGHPDESLQDKTAERGLQVKKETKDEELGLGCY